MTAFNDFIWAVQKSDGTCRMTVDYRDLNKVTSSLTVTVPDMVTLTGKTSKDLLLWKVVMDLANDFFSTAIAPESQDQFAFAWQQKQYTLQALSQGHKNVSLHLPPNGGS